MDNLSRFPDLPAHMKALPVDYRGFPVPWFVAWEDGKPLFPVADGRKFAVAIKQGRCWVCGEALGRYKAFVIGPMCAVNRTSSEPPSHLDCAQFSARNCPFLTKPRMKRVDHGKLPIEVTRAAGEGILRNPGVTLVWVSTKFSTFSDGRGGWLVDIGEPHNVEWYAHGRTATRAEIMESITSGLPLLEEMVAKDPRPAAARVEFDRRVGVAMELVPA